MLEIVNLNVSVTIPTFKVFGLVIIDPRQPPTTIDIYPKILTDRYNLSLD